MKLQFQMESLTTTVRHSQDGWTLTKLPYFNISHIRQLIQVRIGYILVDDAMEVIGC